MTIKRLLFNYLITVELRNWKSGKTILRINFYYRGVQCRETLKLDIAPSNIKYADRLRSEILSAIERGTFSYADYFPESKMARRFGHVKTNITIGELLTGFLEQIQATREHSTFIGYKKVCEARLIPYFGQVAKEQKPLRVRATLCCCLLPLTHSIHRKNLPLKTGYAFFIIHEPTNPRKLITRFDEQHGCTL